MQQSRVSERRRHKRGSDWLFLRCLLSLYESSTQISKISFTNSAPLFGIEVSYEDLSGPHRSNRWNNSSHSCRRISSMVAPQVSRRDDRHPFKYQCANTQTHSGTAREHCSGDLIANQSFQIARCR
ncbi:unnamed protein product [Hymenolepis diminuta]|uniref:Uncharacterized protein n=1 Tax=Hymenolepis diminuta TaxID=6216 RepID=A0A3P7A7Q1_HYMDI|nr:unnamed protein product [Hymenolepis diminuta]